MRLVSGPDAAPATAGPRPLRPKRHHRHLRPWTRPGSDHTRRSASVARNAITGRPDPRQDRVLGHASAPRQAVRAQGPLQTSYAPTSITDVPATLLDLAGLPNALGRGASVLRIDPAASRQRTYAHHEPQARPNPFYDVLYVFSVNGPITDPDAWSYDRTYSGQSMIVQRNAESIRSDCCRSG